VVRHVAVCDHAKTVTTPPKELRGFTKVALQPGQSQRVSIAVARADLEHFSIAARAWVYEGGPVTVLIGSSSRDIRAAVDIEVPGRPVSIPLTVWSTFREWREHPMVGPQLEQLLVSRVGIRGRMADLLSDETGRDSVLEVPPQTLLEFPGVPLTAADAQALVADSTWPIQARKTVLVARTSTGSFRLRKHQGSSASQVRMGSRLRACFRAASAPRILVLISGERVRSIQAGW
jgi:hypothetical protein